FFFSSRRRHTRSKRDWSSDVCSSDLVLPARDDTEAEARAELRYSFEPGTEGDGVTAEIQLNDLDRADPHAFSWHVPGLRIEFMAALIRSLPKAKRTYFVPRSEEHTSELQSRF